MQKKGSKGFTLLELMITLIVATILVVGVVPNLASFVNQNRSASVTNDLLAAIQFARSEAIARSVPVALCRRPQVDDAGAACTSANLSTVSHCNCVSATTNSLADGWEDGWLVVADTVAPEGVSAGDALLRVQAPVGGGYTIRGVNGDLRDAITFQRDGTAQASFGSLFICGTGTDTASDSERMRLARKIVVSLTGQSTAAAFASGDECFPS